MGLIIKRPTKSNSNWAHFILSIPLALWLIPEWNSYFLQGLKGYTVIVVILFTKEILDKWFKKECYQFLRFFKIVSQETVDKAKNGIFDWKDIVIGLAFPTIVLMFTLPELINGLIISLIMVGAWLIHYVDSLRDSNQKGIKIQTQSKVLLAVISALFLVLVGMLIYNI